MQRPSHVQPKQLYRYPQKLYRLFFGVLLLTGVQVILGDVSSFLLQGSKNLISGGFIAASLIVFVLYYARGPVENLIYNVLDEKRILLDEAETIHLSKLGSEILLLVKGKVMIRDKTYGYQKNMTSSNILTTLKSYLQLVWKKQLFWYRNTVQLVSIVVMLIGFFLVANVEISNVFLFYLITLFGIAVEILFRYKWILIRNKSRQKRRQCTLLTNNALQDILELEPFDNQHAQFMIDNFVSASTESFSVQRKVLHETNVFRVIQSVLSMIATLGIVSIKIFETGLSNFSLEVLVGSIALVSIYSQLTRRVASIVEIIFDYRELHEEQKVHEEDFNLIMEVYEKEKEKVESNPAILSQFILPPFNVAYSEEANKNKPFQLVSDSSISLKKGDFVMLRGVTGSGKTTLIKLLTQTLVFDNFKPVLKVETDGTVKTLTHQVFISIGTKPLITELTLGKADYDHEKLISILKAFHLYEEFEQKNEDVLELLSSTTKSHFSAGQLQRLALTRTLFNMDDDVQIVAFDESINNLDDGIALQALEFIREYCKDKLVIFSTHQVELCRKIATHELTFTHSATNTFTVKEI